MSRALRCLFAVFLLLAPAAGLAAPRRGEPAPDVHTVLDVGQPLGPGDYVWDTDEVSHT